MIAAHARSSALSFRVKLREAVHPNGSARALLSSFNRSGSTSQRSAGNSFPPLWRCARKPPPLSSHRIAVYQFSHAGAMPTFIWYIHIGHICSGSTSNIWLFFYIKRNKSYKCSNARPNMCKTFDNLCFPPPIIQLIYHIDVPLLFLGIFGYLLCLCHDALARDSSHACD